MTTWYSNSPARQWVTTAPPVDTLAFHQSLPRYAETPLVSLPSLAAELGVAHVVVKQESSRLGLPAFKILGASYAVARALSAHLGSSEVLPLAELRERHASSGLSIVAATDGNHGRAVAHMAALLGVPAHIFVPSSITTAAQRAIAGEGAELTVLDIPYDDVVQHAREIAGTRGALLVQDSSWPGYTDVPGWIVDGYSTLFREADAQLAALGLPAASLVTVPTGVGALAVAAVDHYRRGSSDAPVVLVVEPDTAPCVITSLHAGEMVAVTTGNTIMNGLNCGVVSPGAWPPMRDGVDAAITVTDDGARLAVHDLAALGVDSGPCGASSLAAVRALCASPDRRLDTGITADSVLLLLSTEGLAANPLPS